MNKWIKRGAIAIGALVVAGAAAIAAGTQLADRKMNRRIDVAVQPVALREDAQAIERGRYLFACAAAPNATARTAPAASSSTTARA